MEKTFTIRLPAAVACSLALHLLALPIGGVLLANSGNTHVSNTVSEKSPAQNAEKEKTPRDEPLPTPDESKHLAAKPLPILPALPELKPEIAVQQPPKPKPARKQPRLENEPQEVQLGKAGGQGDVQIAWISYDDFQQLIAPKGRTMQPALQQSLQPQPDAAVRVQPATPEDKPLMRLAQAASNDTTASAVDAASASASDTAAPNTNTTDNATASETPNNTPTGTGTSTVSKATVNGIGRGQTRATDAQLLPSPAGPPMPAPMTPVKIADPVKPPLGKVPVVVDPVAPKLPLPAEPKSTTMPNTPVPAISKEPQLPRPPTVREVPLPQTQPTTISPSPSANSTHALDGQMIALAPIDLLNAPAAAPSTSEPEKQGNSKASAPKNASSPAPTERPAATLGNLLPTAAPRSDRESMPISLNDKPIAIAARVGSVRVADGIEMKTALPVISVVTASSSLPENPIALLTFSADGKVSQVQLTHSTGYADWDGPVIASFYKWRATGKRLEELNHTFTLTIHLILTRE